MNIIKKISGIILCLILGINYVFADATTSTEPKVITLDFSKPSTMTITGGLSGGGVRTPGDHTEECKITVNLDCISLFSTSGYEDAKNGIIHFYSSSQSSIKCTKGNINKIVFYFSNEKANQPIFPDNTNYSYNRNTKKNTGTWKTSKELNEMTFSASGGQIQILKIEVTYTPTSDTPDTPTLEDPQFTFPNTSYTLKYGETLSLSATSAAGSTGAVTYDLSNLQDNQLATVTANQSTGQVDIKAGSSKTGSFTLTANMAATDKYQSASATCTVNIIPNDNTSTDTPVAEDADDAKAPSTVFRLVTDVKDLHAGDQVIFAAEPEGLQSVLGMSDHIDSYTRSSVVIPIDFTTHTFTAPTACQMITLEGTKDQWYFNTGDGYLCAPSERAGINTKLAKDDKAKATIAITGSLAAIRFQGANDYSDFRCYYNTQTQMGYFKCYAKSSTTGISFSIYKGMKQSVDFTNSSSMRTLWTTHPLDFTHIKGVKAYIAAIANGQVQFTRVRRVPAETGVLLVSARQGNAQSSIPILDNVTDQVSSEFVAGTGKAVPSTDGEYTNYILNNGENGLGFYLANNQVVAIGKAYLRTKSSQAAAYISIPSDLTTDISNISAIGTSIEGNTYYTLGGIPVTTPQKGKLYIHNHKKITY